MAFTYNADVSTTRDKVRLYSGDTVDGTGPRPDQRNFTDAEMDFFLSENGSGVPATVSTVFETLASEWSSYTVSERQGEVSVDTKGIAAEYNALAKKWKKIALGTLGYSSVASSTQPERIDGYNPA